LRYDAKDSKHGQSWRQRLDRDSRCDVRVPGKIFDPNPAGAEEMVRIKLPRDLVSVRVPPR